MSDITILVLLLLASKSAWFGISIIRKRNDVADVAWGLSFILLVWASFILSDSSSIRSLMVVLLVSIWGIRLTWHINSRNRGKAEDYRYLAWRNDWGKWFYLRSYFQVYILQGLLALIVVAPVLVINLSSNDNISILDVVGIILWLIGFFFESVGDAQLTKFIKNPENKGKLMQSGLWKYTRHPNYFGEVTQWWGIWFFALSVPWGFWSFVGPLTITFLILKVSGIPLLEKKMAENPEFQDYKNKTSIFIPWFSLR